MWVGYWMKQKTSVPSQKIKHNWERSSWLRFRWVIAITPELTHWHLLGTLLHQTVQELHVFASCFSPQGYKSGGIQTIHPTGSICSQLGMGRCCRSWSQYCPQGSQCRHWLQEFQLPWSSALFQLHRLSCKWATRSRLTRHMGRGVHQTCNVPITT